MGDVVLIEKVSPHVRLIKLNRPDQLNAMTAELCEALHAELERAARGPLVPRDRVDRARAAGSARASTSRATERRRATTAPTPRATTSATRSTCRG